MPVLSLAGCYVQRNKTEQVRVADQAMYHQGNQSVFVGGRLWTLLPPPALEVYRLFRRVTHTHTERAGGCSSSKGCEMIAKS